MIFAAEILEVRRLLSGGGSNAVLAEDYAIVLADQQRVAFDQHQLRTVGTLDRNASIAATKSDQAQIKVDTGKLHRDLRSKSTNAVTDLNQLEADEGNLRSQILMDRVTASSDRKGIRAKIKADGVTLRADQRQLRMDLNS